MGGLPLNCPLCCNKTFNSKKLLTEHLSNVFANVYCPVCNIKCTSLSQLIEHLSQDNCQSDGAVHTIIFEETSHGNSGENASDIESSDIKMVIQNGLNTDNASIFSTEHSYEAQVDPNDDNKMYVELFTKQLPKPCLQTRELKLVKENGESRYMIVSHDDTELNAGSPIVTKQNTDGTISLTTVKDMKLENDVLIAATGNLPEDSQEEIYSCNTCKVSFSSVIEHIQNYHNDQEVVVEEPMEETEYDILPVGNENLESEDLLLPTDKQPPRRVITDTGDIIEESLILKSENITMQSDLNESLDSIQQDTKYNLEEKHDERAFSNIGSSVIKEGTQIEDKDKRDIKRSHKVVPKEVPTDSGFSIKMYQCLTCNITATNLKEFQMQTCKTVKYSCPFCPVTYENSKSLCAHMKVHKVKVDRVGKGNVPRIVNKEPAATVAISYECGICFTVFPSNKSLKLHKRMHNPIKSRPIEPPIETIDGSEVSEGRYRCNICEKLIPEDYRTIHQNSHKSSEKINCAICNKKFTSTEYLEMHMTVHNLDKAPIDKQDQSLPYNCLYCKRRFARPHEKVKHERIHTGEKPHSCEICGKSFRVSYCLTLHMRTHTGARPYACPHCNKKFKAHSVYNHHLLTHSEVRAYKCPFCPKAFKTSVQLAGHKNSHTKPFSCTHCNRPFASLYAVRVHTETHSRQNNLKFSCELCGASYARAFALKDHVKQAHNQEQAQSPPQAITADDDWTISKDSPDPDGLNKDLTHDMDLGMSGGEL